ncbi:MAG TPA: nuclear transport factor 2 family protein [Dehalococcoidia bacterium]|nr:nuclear transport factor 2 family protein [Dehalococcoidia bacterium]
MELEAAALAANEAFYAPFNQKDAALMDAIWADSADVTCIHPGWNLLQGRDGVLESWRNILTNPAQPRIVTGGAKVSLHGSIAVVVCRELVGGSPLIATNVFVLESETWKLLHHHSGPVLGGNG